MISESRLQSHLRTALDRDQHLITVGWLSSIVQKITKESDSTLTLHLKDGEKLTGFNKILIAIGRKPMTDTLNLDVS